MTKFKIGDNVKIIKPDRAAGFRGYLKAKDRCAEITDVREGMYPYIVKYIDNNLNEDVEVPYIYRDKEIRLATNDDLMVEVL